jgi:hypothetical protein
MRIKIFAAIIISLLPFNGSSQNKILLHSFTKHLEVEDKAAISCYSSSIKGWYEDYALNLFSDSTFRISYFYSGGREIHQDHQISETAKGIYYSRSGSIYLTLAEEGRVFSSNTLYEMFFNGPVLRIEYDADNLSLYNARGRTLVFKKAGVLDNYKTIKKTSDTCPHYSFSPQLSNKGNSF